MMDGNPSSRSTSGWSPWVKDEHAETPVLGVAWNVHGDTLSINLDLNELKENTVISKRLILSYAQKIFDPIGFASPTTLFPKLLLQQTWKNKLSWDAPLDPETKQNFCD